MGKHLEQALPSVYTLQCLTGKVDNNNNNNKIVRNLLVLPNHCLPQPTPVSYTRANNPLKFAQLQSKIDLYKYSFLPRTIIDWNNLKIDNIDIINFDTFKNIIDKLNNL